MRTYQEVYRGIDLQDVFRELSGEWLEEGIGQSEVLHVMFRGLDVVAQAMESQRFLVLYSLLKRAFRYDIFLL